jgi:transketolase
VAAEDHHREGGLGEAVVTALSAAGIPARIEHLAVRLMPGSGSPGQLLDQAGLSGSHIAAAVHRLLADLEGISAIPDEPWRCGPNRRPAPAGQHRRRNLA